MLEPDKPTPAGIVAHVKYVFEYVFAERLIEPLCLRMPTQRDEKNGIVYA